MLQRMINKVFRFEDLTPEEDGSYLLRWTLLYVPFFKRKLYLHKIISSDWAREPHDHPKDFLSIGLWGKYTEYVYGIDKEDHHYDTTYRPWRIVPGKKSLQVTDIKRWKAPWIRRFPANHIHRLVIPLDSSPAWTLCWTSERKVSEWGFYRNDGTFVPFQQFLKQRG